MKDIVEIVTPLLVFVFGIVISKKLEKVRLNVLKEKEWQVRWADLFFTEAIEFNDNVSFIIYTLFKLFHNEVEKSHEEIERLRNDFDVGRAKLSEINWNIRNYTQFSNTGELVVERQLELMLLIQKIATNNGGDYEEVRKVQFDYNRAVRQVHNDILNQVL
ncbi:hypothetical protein HNP24_002856 [Chryseobacterium sediminis]|uniref:Uncharacterized protein n=1 Tax=Chryseobacterium sediminis TaxID=1679494 RepID=A0ABR6Q2J4_9FLAO|nr:hypothetical protein [Chryseobacterium sediminis]MBB6331906.1 hypothetical protein [Chryseobacterium sediminis]